MLSVVRRLTDGVKHLAWIERSRSKILRPDLIGTQDDNE